MKKALLLIALLVAITPIYSSAQQAGTFVGSVGLGIPSAQGDFSKSDLLSAGSGFGIEGELRYYVLNGFAIGALGNWMRFGSSISTLSGRVSYNFDQLGATARLNLIPLSNGAIFINGGGGTFTPNVHYYVPDASVDFTAPKSGYFGFGGIGLTSQTHQKTLYELEFRYNIGRADISSSDFSLPGAYTTNVWDFFYVGFKLSFASKGKEAPARY
ncbi:MAG TPA: hypothetical protein DCZ43_00380 [candidate division Zixibacteria bacterium]|nr:hypothetical protein [candidate division Zixibacteria bacterium]